jgi:hypothetical protein
MCQVRKPIKAFSDIKIAQMLSVVTIVGRFTFI